MALEDAVAVALMVVGFALLGFAAVLLIEARRRKGGKAGVSVSHMAESTNTTTAPKSNAKEAYQYRLKQAADIISHLKNSASRHAAAKTLAWLEEHPADPDAAELVVNLIELLAEIERVKAGDVG